MIDDLTSILPQGIEITPPHPESDFDDMFRCDRNWFLCHPGESEYYRKPFDEEISQFGKCDLILVRELAPGVRVRIPTDLVPIKKSRRKTFWDL